MPEFTCTEPLPPRPDGTGYLQLDVGGVSGHAPFRRKITETGPGMLTTITSTAMREIVHLLRPGHLAQPRPVPDDPEASPNSRYMALDLLKNVHIAAGGVLPMCQDTSARVGRGVLAERPERDAA